jgi:hypothetical protein
MLFEDVHVKLQPNSYMQMGRKNQQLAVSGGKQILAGNKFWRE